MQGSNFLQKLSIYDFEPSVYTLIRKSFNILKTLIQYFKMETIVCVNRFPNTDSLHTKLKVAVLLLENVKSILENCYTFTRKPFPHFQH